MNKIGLTGLSFLGRALYEIPLVKSIFDLWFYDEAIESINVAIYFDKNN